MTSFSPNRRLALRAMQHQAKQLWHLPTGARVILFGFLSALALIKNGIRFYDGQHVPAYAWIGSVLMSPLVLAIILVSQFLVYRFAPGAALSSKGLRIGLSHVLPFWKPAYCVIEKHEDPALWFLLHIYIKSPLGKKLRCCYSAPGDDLSAAGAFLAEFNRKYNSAPAGEESVYMADS